MIHGLHTGLLVAFGFFVAGSAGYCTAQVLDLTGMDRTLSGGAGAVIFGTVVIIFGNALSKKRG